MKKLLLPAVISMLLSAPVSAQLHSHMVPHTTTHVDAVQHGNHFHMVPHTTTHFDQVLHNGPDYVPHTTTHFDSVQHGNHFHTVPHTTTHYDPVYPSVGSGVIYPQSGPVISSGVISQGVSNVIPSVSNVIPSSNNVISSSNVITSAPPQTVVNKPIVSGSSSNVIPSSASSNVIPASASGAGRTIQITNPSESGGDIRYSVNEFSYTIKPGQSQTLNLDRNWTIAFDNGLGRRLNYRLNEGQYKFTVSAQKGWDVERIEVAAPAPPAAPAAPASIAPPADANAIPKL